MDVKAVGLAVSEFQIAEDLQAAAGPHKGRDRHSCCARGRSSITQFRFPLGGGWQGILFRLDRTLARLLHPSGLSCIEFNVRLKLRRNVFRSVDGVHRAFIHASHAIYALLRVTDELTDQL